MVEAYFGAFRRCNYPWTHPDTRRIELVEQCGRYRAFQDIPSIWWQVATVTVGVGSALALLVPSIFFLSSPSCNLGFLCQTAFISVPACCVQDIISRTSARLLGILQVFAGQPLLPVLPGLAWTQGGGWWGRADDSGGLRVVPTGLGQPGGGGCVRAPLGPLPPGLLHRRLGLLPRPRRSRPPPPLRLPLHQSGFPSPCPPLQVPKCPFCQATPCSGTG